MKYSNCIFFALALYWRQLKRGNWGYIIVRKSHWGWFPHLAYMGYRPKTKSWKIVGFVPANPRLKILPPPIFSGKIRWGDSAHAASEKQ